MWLEIVLLLVGFGALIKGADWLVEGASSIAKKLGIRDIVIGLTVVSFGTSAPELVVNMFSAWSGTTELAIGNVVGSNIINILLILGVAAAIYPLRVKRGTVWKEIPLALLAAVAVWLLINDGLIDGSGASVITRIDGLILLLFFAIFMYYTYGISKVSGSEDEESEIKAKPGWLAGGMVLGGMGGLVLGGKLIVDAAVTIASGWGVSQSLIGLTVVAIGTSLPELATSAIAALKKRADIAVGNVVGSNIFNLLFILALTGAIFPLPIMPNLNIDIGMMIAVSMILFMTMFVGKKHILERWQGVSFIGLYVVYTIYLVWRG
jgi:cation:H+ antiporter